MRAFRAGVPWDATLHSWTLLDSHDIARFRTVAGSRERALVGIGLQMTTPGVPMLFAGDELGLEGAWGEDARRTMPWDRPETWDAALLDDVPAAARAAALERRARARRHPLRCTSATTRSRTCARRGGERLLCLAARARARPDSPAARRARRAALETLYGDEATLGGDGRVLPGDGPAFHVWRIGDEGAVTVAEVAFNDVDKVYDNGVQAVDELSLEIARRRVPRARRPVRLRQDDRAADGRRARGDLRRRRSRSATASSTS